MNNIIEFDMVSKSFGELKVLDQLNLEVKDGETVSYTHLTLPTNREV